MDLIKLFEHDDIFNYIMHFVNVIIDAKSMILVNKNLYELLVNHELFQSYMKLIGSLIIHPCNTMRGTPQYYFMKACYHGNSLYKNIIATNKIDIHANNEYAFQFSCRNDHLEVAKWLIELSQSDGFTLINIHADDELAFKLSCGNGHLEVAKWLIELSQSEGFSLIDIHIDDEFAFRASCVKGHLEVAKWLIELSRCTGFTPIPHKTIDQYLKN